MSRLKELRTEAGLSQFELAVRVGVTPAYIGYLENGDRDPSLSVAKRIADYFDTTVDDIFLPNDSTKCTTK